MTEFIFYFLALLNPFALFIYLLPLKRELAIKDYSYVLARASLISFLIYVFFAIFGDAFFREVLKIEFASFQIFGGLVLVSFALSFIIQGKESMITTKGELSKIAGEVALPFMVGAGTITLSILIGQSLGAVMATAALTVIMVANFIIIMAIAAFRGALKPNPKIVFDKNLEILLRINGFIVGAFGVDLIISGIQKLI